MANEEHFGILKNGIEAWNAWREESPGVRPNLSKANLSRAELGEADLSRADLSNADLSRAELGEADLSRADLSNADLTRAGLYDANLGDANLTRANLTRADLSYANLSDADLSGATLHFAYFRRAHLSYVNLLNTYLNGADFTDTNLFGAKLTNAQLNHAKLTNTVFIDADLSGSNLSDADLSNADLTNANLAGAELSNATFCNVDLRCAKSLDTIVHRGPSTIGTNTLQCSHGQIPEVFLKGCGLTDWEIEATKLYNPNITEDERTLITYEILRIQGEQPIMQSRVFISYSHKDTPFVETLEKLLDSKGIRYWRDVHDLKAGRLEDQIDRGIELNRLVLLILSENSVRSDWVEHEAATARELERKLRDQGSPKDVLCPIRLDDACFSCDWPRVLRRQIEDYNILDFSGWRDAPTLAKQFAKLYDGLLLNY